MSRTTTVVGPEAAAEVLGVIQAAFGARPPLDPPAPALLETLESVAAALATDGGLLLTANGVAIGARMFRREGDPQALPRFVGVPEAPADGSRAREGRSVN